MNRYLPVIAPSLLLLAACGNKDHAKPANDEPAPAAAKVVAEEAPPAAPTYTPELAAKLTADLSACSSPYSCDALKQLIEFGNKASGGLVDLAVDAGKSSELRRIAAHGLGEIKDPAVGLKLFEAGKAEEDFILRGELFKAAGASGGADTFQAMADEYASDASKQYRTELGFGLEAFDGATVMAYATEHYPEDPRQQVRFADLVRKSATDAAQVAPLLDKTKDPMARHRLASKLVALGDTSKLEILYAGLASKDVYDRSDAGNILADVADKIPADRKAEVIELAKKAKAADSGGLTSGGYDRVLKELGAN